MVTFDLSEATKRAIEALTPSGFEQLAYAVVRNAHPHVRRLRAPDDGADLLDDGPPKRVWQAKHHKQIDWAKCTQSLARASGLHAPARVTFVFPQDLTGAQEKKFQALRATALPGVEVDVVGFTWFDAELDRPQLRGVRERLLSARSPSLVQQALTLAHPPVIPRHWTPRNDMLAKIDDWWQQGTENVFAVVGLGGSGKSTLVQRWLDDVSSEVYTGGLEGVLQFSLYEHGERAFSDFLAMANRALGTPLAAGDEVDALLDLLAARRILIVLDGAERLLREYASAAPEFVEEREPEEILPNAREVVDEAAWRFVVGLASRDLTGRVILTTRLLPLDLDAAERCRELTLGGLTPEESTELLHRLEIDGSDAALKRAAASLDGHPLSLARLANVLRGDPVTPGSVRNAPRYHRMLDFRRRRRDIFDRAFDVLTATQRQVLLLLAAARGRVAGSDVAAISAAAGMSLAGATIQQLVHELWIDQDAEGGVRLHSVARSWLSGRDPDPRRTHAVHVELWRPRASALNLRVVAEREHARVSDLLPVIELVFHLARAGRWDEAWQTLDGELSAILAGRFSAHAIRSELLFEFFPDGDETRHPLLTDVQAQGSLLNSVANDLTLLGQPVRAIPPLERAVELGRRSRPNALAVRLGNLALTRIRVGQLRQSDAELNEQRAVGEECGDRTNELVALQEQARLAALCGRYSISLEMLDAAESIIGELAGVSDSELEGFSPLGWSTERKRRYIALNRAALGAAYRALVLLLRGDDARGAGHDAVAAAAKTGEARSRARAQALFAASLAAAGDFGTARQTFDELMLTVRAVGIGDMEPELLTGLAVSWLVENRRHAADLGRLALREARRNGNQLQVADALLVSARAAERTERQYLAESARRSAWFDGPPFFYESVVRNAETITAEFF